MACLGLLAATASAGCLWDQAREGRLRDMAVVPAADQARPPDIQEASDLATCAPLSANGVSAPVSVQIEPIEGASVDVILVIDNAGALTEQIVAVENSLGNLANLLKAGKIRLPGPVAMAMHGRNLPWC